MKILKLLIVFCLLASGRGEAQEVYYSQYENYDWRTGDYAIAGKVNGLQYIYRSNANNYYLDAYDDNMEKVATVVLDFFSGRIYDTRFVNYANQMIVLYQSVDGGKVTQYAALLDDKGRLLKRPVVIDAAKQAFFGNSRNYFRMAVSEDKKRIIVYETDTKGNKLDVDCTWLDDQLNVLSKCHTSFNAGNYPETGEGLLHNDGTFYLPTYTPTGSRSYADQLYLLVLPQTERKFTPKELPLDNMYAAGTYMKLDNANDKIYIAGFYSDKKGGLYEGVLYTYYNLKTGSYEKVKLMSFDGNEGAIEKTKKKALSDFQVRNLIVKNDGGFLLIAEDFFVTNRSSYQPGFGYYSFYYPTMGASVREYNYRDIMAMSYDGEGNGQWRSFIRKDQYSQEDGGMFSSFAMINTGGALGFMFNDFNTVRSKIQLATLDADGKVAMQSLGAANGNDADWMPRQAKQVASRELIVPCLRKRQICFAKIVF